MKSFKVSGVINSVSVHLCLTSSHVLTCIRWSSTAENRNGNGVGRCGATNMSLHTRCEFTDSKTFFVYIYNAQMCI